MSSPSSELNPLRHALVRAGAGAGKTRGLVEKVVAVYRHFQSRPGRELPRIVLTTFTRKATQELKERLILKACAERDAGLLQFVSDPSRLHISTIHGLLNVFLRQVGHLAGLDAGHQIAGETDGERLARLALRQTLVEHPEHLAWLENYGFARVLSMAERFAEAENEQAELLPAELEALRAAALEETERWRTELTRLALLIMEEVDEASWQAYALELQTFAASWDGTPTGLKEIPSKPRRSKKQAEFEAWHDRVDEVVGECKKAMGRDCWDPALWPAMVAAWTEFRTLGTTFARHLAQLKEQRACLLMSDLELKSLQILREKPFLGQLFAEAWDFWMIDEYQDTSPVQVECLQALIGDRPRYYVGDPQQSIYLFRGAEVSVFMAAETQTRDSGGEVRELRRNYRSAPDLLLWINDFIKALGDGFSAMEPRQDGLAPERARVRLLRADDEASELEAIVSRVGELIQAGARPEQICVLGRTHQNLMQVSRALKQYGYPTHVHAARGFNQRREVIDAQAIWKFLVNPHDNINLMVLLRSPWFYVEDWQLAEWMSQRPQSLWRGLMAKSDGVESIARLKALVVLRDQCGLSRAFEEALCTCGLLDLSLVNDPAGRRESNLWKLIDRARTQEKEGGLSVLDFLEAEAGLEGGDSSEGDATSAQEPGCINLMTIHGSKGLEFEHVLLPRMGQSPRASTTPPLQAEDGRFFFPVWFEESGDFKASPLDVLSVRRQNQKELAEFDRWLYVALTRAKESLTLSWSRRERDSWAARGGWFDQVCGRYENEKYIYEVAEEWPSPVPYAGAEAAVTSVRPLWRAPMETVSPRLAVTDLLSTHQALAGPEGLRRFEAQVFGSRLHKRLEALKYGGVSESARLDGPEAFVLSLKDPPIEEILHSGHSEWGFLIQRRSGVIEGQIDLWGKAHGKLYVIDYKSGSSARLEEAFKQLSIYAWALRQFAHTEPIEMVVIYPMTKKVERRPFTEELARCWEVEFGGA